MKIFISGPITTGRFEGKPYSEPYREFEKIENALRIAFPNADIYNPCKELDGENSRAVCMRACIKQLLSMSSCDLFVQIDGWDESEGACCENSVATQIGLIYYDVHKLLDFLAKNADIVNRMNGNI